MNSKELLNGLNKQQKEAVEHTEGPLLILAGAGSGKTRVLTYRTGYLIDSGVAPYNILAITFTNKAAGEMKERIGKLLGNSVGGRVFISTFHSMCVRLLRQDIDRLGYSRDFTIYDTDDQRSLIRNVIKKLNLDSKIYKERAVLKIISTQKNIMVDAEEYGDSAGDFYDRNVAKIYSEYEKELKANNAMDFDDLLLKTVGLFEKNPEVLGKWQERFKYIMVDEYQDTNNVQFELVRMLAGKYGNLCVVGDDDQSIYKFRGANIENILSFEKVFPKAKVIKLEQNYRSTKSILNAANEVIKNNMGRKVKRLWTENDEGDLPVYNEYDTAAGEAENIIRQAELARIRGTKLKDQAVLYRTNAQSRLLEEKCIARNIPYTIVGGVNFYQRKEVKDILAYLRLLVNTNDDVSLRRIINVPKRGIGQTTIDKVASYADGYGCSMYDAVLEPENVAGTAAAVKKLRIFTDYIESLKGRLREGVFDIKAVIESILEDAGYADELKKDDPVQAESRIENINELVSKAVSFTEDYLREYQEALDSGNFQISGMNTEGFMPEGFMTEEFMANDLELSDDGLSILSAFLEDVSLVADIDRMNDTDDVLTMMTLHAAKGLEFDTVYLCGMEEGLFPSSASINANDPVAEIEEERRLCYVGITRARKKLIMSSARERMVNGEVHTMRPSRFIDEIPDDMAEKNFRRKSSGSKDPFAGFGGYEGRLGHQYGDGSDLDGYRGGRGSYGGSYGAGSRGSYGRSYDDNGSYGRGYETESGNAYGGDYGLESYSDGGTGSSYSRGGYGSKSANGSGYGGFSGSGSSGNGSYGLGNGSYGSGSSGNHYDHGNGSYGSGNSSYGSGSSAQRQGSYTGNAGLFGSLDTSRRGNGYTGRKKPSNLPGVTRGFKSSQAETVKQKPDYGVGDRVKHSKFGEGTVTAIVDEPRDYKVTVAFDTGESRIMLAGFAKLTKVNEN